MNKYYPISFTRPENTEIEEYRTIAKAPEYEVSNLGNVRRKATGKILKQERTWNHYLRVNLLREDGTRKHYKVHVLVAEAFVPNPNGYTEVNHRDMDRTNNFYRNLGWTTTEDNRRYTKILRAANPKLVKEIEEQFSKPATSYSMEKLADEAARKYTRSDNNNKTYPRKN